jgi:D-hexose-6-phosphate mutarotase
MTEGTRWEDGPGGLPFLVIETDRCRARLTPYGGQLCEWTPAGQPTPALFLSPRSTFAAGKAIRGGVPVCFPWFGAHPTDRTRPAHGFARTRMWQVEGVTLDERGDIRVAQRLASDAGTRGHWNAEFAASLTISLGTSLAMTFEVENTGADDIAYEIALHAYLAVGDVEKIRVHGLEQTRFLDKVDGMKEHATGAGPLVLAGETDRVFLDTTATCTVDDPTLGRRIRVEKSHSQATVVWNPWLEKAAAMTDLGADAWHRFVCVEAANCGPHAVHLSPRARHAMTARIDVRTSPHA